MTRQEMRDLTKHCGVQITHISKHMLDMQAALRQLLDETEPQPIPRRTPTYTSLSDSDDGEEGE